MAGNQKEKNKNAKQDVSGSSSQSAPSNVPPNPSSTPDSSDTVNQSTSEASNTETEPQVTESVNTESEKAAEGIQRYPVPIKLQNGETIELQLSPGDSLMDVRQLLLDSPNSCYFTCYDLLLHHNKDGSVHHLNNKNEIYDVADISTRDFHLEMVAAPYNDRTIRQHVHHTRDLLMLSTIPFSLSTSLAQKRQTGESSSSKLKDPAKLEVIDIDEMCFLEDPSKSLSSFMLPNKEIQCVQSIEFSSFNPVPGYKRLDGDLVYLDVGTLEGNKCCITGTHKGFYVNQFTKKSLEPRPRKSGSGSTTLVELLQRISSKFKKAFGEVLERWASAHPLENIQPMLSPYPWLGEHPVPDHRRDMDRALNALTLTFGSQMIGVHRDWNEEVQSCREMSRLLLDESLLRDTELNKTSNEFVDAAIDGAIGVINRCIPPIDPTQLEHLHMYVHNNIFFSYAFDADIEELFKRQAEKAGHSLGSSDKDVTTEYQLSGHEQATYATSNNELEGTKSYQEADVSGLYTLAMAIVDYRGHRVLAQSILPDILTRENPDSLVYGSIDDGKTISWNEEFHSKVVEAAKHLHLKEHSVLDGSKNAFTVATPVTCKGEVGCDGRHYLMDLMRITPCDTNYSGLPLQFCMLRRELITAFCKVREAETQKPAHDIRFNPDVFTGITLAGSLEEIAADEELVIKASSYLYDVVVPKFIDDLSTSKVLPMDGQTLTESLHESGINVRYIGKVAMGVRSFPHLWELCSNEIIVRSAKHILKDVLRETVDRDLGRAIAHFFNCLFGNIANTVKASSSGPKIPKKVKTRKGASSKMNQFSNSSITSNSLWSDIQEFANLKYQFELEDTARSQVKKIHVIRNLCLKVGIIIAARGYDLNSGQPFRISDILDLVPVAKHAIPIGLEAKKMIEQGEAQFVRAILSDANELFSDAFNILRQITGPLHKEVANCCRNLSMMFDLNGDIDNAISIKRMEVIINERCLRLDHPNTAHSYANLALYYHHANKIELALKHMERAVVLLSLSSGSEHPDVATAYLNVGVWYKDIGNTDQSFRLLQKALEINIKLFGEQHYQTALCYHALAIQHNSTETHQLAHENEDKAYNILAKILGENDKKTLNSLTWLDKFHMLRRGQEEANARILRRQDIAQGKRPMIAE